MYMPTIDMLQTGQNIKYLRIRRGLSVHDLQEAFGFNTPQAIYKWQNGKALPTVDNLVYLSMLFDVPIDAILILRPQHA